MSVKYSKWPSNISTFSNQGPPKFTYLKWDFWFENKPSGNPGYPDKKVLFIISAVAIAAIGSSKLADPSRCLSDRH
jgi:hypothetical protein